MPDNDTGPLQTDPPILIGGGGSTLIWIRKDQNARRLPPEQVPGTTDKPAHPELYDIYVLDNFDCSQVRVHDGGDAHSIQRRKRSTTLGLNELEFFAGFRVYSFTDSRKLRNSLTKSGN